MNRGKLMAVTFVFLALLWGVLIYRDMGMDEGGHKEYGTPEVVLRGIDLEREVSGDVWVLPSDRAGRYETLNRLESIDVVLTTSDGEIWLMKAPEGTVTHDAGKIELVNPSGSSEDQPAPVFWKAPLARWDGEKEAWFFPDGLHLWNETVDVRGNTGTIRPGGEMILEKGVAVSWKRPER